jgi:outer membrane protein OmpA-like peptidoglycan-associated protein
MDAIGITPSRLPPSKLGSTLAAGLVLAAISIPFAQAGAQESGIATITINIDVLESLGPEQPDVGRSTAQALKSGSLLAPPQAKPESRLVGQFAAQSPEPLEDEAEEVEEAADKPAKTKKRKAEKVTAEAPSAESKDPPQVAAALDKPEAAAPAPLEKAADKPAKTKKRKAEKVAAETPSTESEAPPEVVAAAPDVVEEAPAALPLVASAEPPAPSAPSTPLAPSESEALPPPVPEVPAPPGQTQTAAVAPTETINLDARLLFAEGSAELSAGDKQKLLAVADQLQRDPEIRIQLLAFAAGDDATPNAARRLSLSRALAVRGFLVDQGITAARVQVRALGQSSEDGPPDRVDIKPQGG